MIFDVRHTVLRQNCWLVIGFVFVCLFCILIMGLYLKCLPFFSFYSLRFLVNHHPFNDHSFKNLLPTL